MTSQASKERIEAAVAQALEATLKQEAYPERLWPFTQAQLNLIRDFVAKALSNVLEPGSASP